MRQSNEKSNDNLALLSEEYLGRDAMIDSVGRWKIHRDHFTATYNVQGGVNERNWLVAETDFNTRKRSSKVSLQDANKGHSTGAVSHMPWRSRKLYLGFGGSDPLQGTHWEEMKRRKKLSWPISEEFYEWSTQIPGEEEDTKLLWVSKMTRGIVPCCGIGPRSYTLYDMRDSGVLAQFYSNPEAFTGGILEVDSSWRQKFAGLDVKLIMAFLSMYETGRRRAHHIVYRPTRTKSTGDPQK